MGEPGNTLSDQELMGLYQGGDADAFGVLFGRHRRQLFTFLVHRVGDRTAAEDLFQEIFLKLIHGRDQYQASRSFRAWLYTIARNAVTDRHRKQGVREVEILESAMGDEHNEVRLEAVAADASPVEQLGALDLREHVEVALGKLPGEQREVFLLRERAKLDYERIAELTGCKIATAKSRMRYALVALRRHLTEAGFGEHSTVGGTHE